MPKHPIRKTKKSPKKTLLNHLTNNPLELVAVLIIIAIAAGLIALLISQIQNHIAINGERKQYALAQQDLKRLVGLISKEVGKPDVTSNSQSCSYANREFYKGPLSCSVNVGIIYGTSDISSADNLSRRESNVLKNSGVLTYNNYSQISNDSQSSPARVLSEDYRNSKTGIYCSAIYTFFEKDTLSGESQNFAHKLSSGHGLQLYISCGGQAKAAYFPIVD